MTFRKNNELIPSTYIYEYSDDMKNICCFFNIIRV